MNLLKNIEKKGEKMTENNEENDDVEKIEKIENIKDDEIMTLGEVAAYFKIDQQSIINLVQEGEIPAFRIGEHWRIKKSDIGSFIDELIKGKRV